MKRFAFLLLAFAGTIAYGASDKALVARFLKYRDLIRLTEEQIDMVESTKMSCADPRGIYGIHRQPGIHIYASQSAIEARKKNPTSHRLPIGTVLVKEKFETKGGDKPSILTVMEKTADNGKIDDWQFYMIRIADRTIVRDGFKVSCIDCHTHYAKSDFVSRETDWLLSEIAEK